jgi:hypothetical protein
MALSLGPGNIAAIILTLFGETALASIKSRGAYTLKGALTIIFS